VSTIPADTRAEMVRLYVEERQSIRQIARRVFWSYCAVHGTLTNEGVQLRSRGQVLYPRSCDLTQDQKDRTVEHYQSGHSAKWIADRFGLHVTTIHKRLHRAGVPLRTTAEAQRLERLDQISARGIKALTARQSAALLFIEQNDARVTTEQVARAIGAQTSRVRVVLIQLRGFGLVASRRTGERLLEWSRTDLALRDVLEHALTPPAQRRAGEVWLPIEPLRAWLEQQIDAEQRRILRIPTAEDNGIAPAPGAARVATRLELDERRLYALRFEQSSVTLSMADQCLLHAGDGTMLEDLWPELGCDEEVARLPRSYQQRDRQLEAAA
jgi:transposase-like protein